MVIWSTGPARRKKSASPTRTASARLRRPGPQNSLKESEKETSPFANSVSVEKRDVPHPPRTSSRFSDRSSKYINLGLLLFGNKAQLKFYSAQCYDQSHNLLDFVHWPLSINQSINELCYVHSSHGLHLFPRRYLFHAVHFQHPACCCHVVAGWPLHRHYTALVPPSNTGAAKHGHGLPLPWPVRRARMEPGGLSRLHSVRGDRAGHLRRNRQPVHHQLTT